MINPKTNQTNQRLDLLSEIEQTPEEYIPELLNIVRLFRQSAIADQSSTNAWDNAIAKLKKSEQNQEKPKKIQQLFQSWAELDDEKEQQETLKIIESIEDVSI